MDQIFDAVIGLVFAIAAPVIAGLVSVALAKFIQQTGLTIGAETQKKLEAFAMLAVLQTEEWARARGKALIPTTSADKFKNAVQFVLARVPGVSQDEAAAIVQAQLPIMRAQTVGFLQAVQQAAVTETLEPAQ